MAAVLTWVGHHWGLLFLLWFLGVFSGVRNFILDTLSVITGHPRPVRELEWDDDDDDDDDEEDEQPTPQPAVTKRPGPCVHRNVSPIVSVTDEVVGWLCKTCTKRLPADWAVREEDL